MRELKFNQAIAEAIDLSMARDSRVYVLGLGVPDPKGIFGTTLGLEQKYGKERVLDLFDIAHDLAPRWDGQIGERA